MSKYTTEAFIAKAKEVHGDKYDYREVAYEGAQKKVILYCDVHGRFEIEASSHLKGYGCRRCSYPERYDSFETKARKVHGNRYDYSLSSDCTNVKNNVDIVCSVHGKFTIVARHHLNGKGCPACSPLLRSKKHEIKQLFTDRRPKSLEAHIAFAEYLHDGYYDYSKVAFDNVMEKVEIICPEHGSFWQSFCSHKTGRGCQACAKRGFNTAKESVFYILEIEGISASFTGYGVSNNFDLRVSQHTNTLKEYGLSISNYWTFSMSGTDALELERTAKREFSLYKTDIVGFRKESTVHSELGRLRLLAEDFTENLQSCKELC